MNEDKKKKIEEIKICSSDSILVALKKMDQTYKRLLLVFDKGAFLNVLSIGDIQRAIIRNQSLETPVNKILREKTKIAGPDDTFGQIRDLMLEYRAEYMPVVNKERKLIDVHFWEDVFPVEEKRIKRDLKLPVVIMAGGKGTRMKPITNVLPKPLIPLGEKPILEHIMEKFAEIGCYNFYLTVNYKADMIRYHFEKLNHPDYNINYFEEEKPLGTAGSLYMLKGKINQTFFVNNCDIIIEEDYSEIFNYHKKYKHDITIVAALKHYSIPYGTIETGKNGILESLNEKPELTYKINSGMYILEPEIINLIPENSFLHITDLIKIVKTNGGKIGVFPVSENSWKDIGDWNEYMKQI